MNNEQKQRAIAALTKWWAADSNKAVLSTGYEMAGVLHELIDAPEQAAGVPDGQLQAAFDRGLKAGSEIAMNQLLEALK